MHSRLTCLLALALLLTGCASIIPSIISTSDICPSTTDTSHQDFGSPDAEDLVIFIHGLCGDAKTTWTNPITKFVFPEALAQDFVTENHPAYVVSFDYVTHLQRGPSILSIASHLEFKIDRLLKKHSYRTLRIVAHSMGGLVARQYVLRLQPQAHPSLKVAGIVLLATPNNGSELSELGRLVSESRQIEEMRNIDTSNAYLRSLNEDWNKAFKADGHTRGVLMYAGFEEEDTRVAGIVVKMSSANLYADGAFPFPLNHFSIAKPEGRDKGVYMWVKDKLEKSLEKTGQKEGNGAVKKGPFPAADTREQEVLAGLESERGSQSQNKMAYHAISLRYRNTSRPPTCFERHQWGTALMTVGDPERAIPHLQEAVRLCKESNDSLLEGLALDDLGVAHNKLKHYTKAIDYHEQALAIGQKIREMEVQYNALKNLSYAYANDGQHEKASNFLKKSKEIEERLQEERLRINNRQDNRTKDLKNEPRN